VQPTHQPPHSMTVSGASASSAREDTASPNPSSSPSQSQKRRLSPGQNQLPLLLMQARLSRGWTQQQLADLIGTTPQTVSRWERGIATPGLYHRGKLCALFGLSLAELGCSLEASTESEADTVPGNEAGQAAGERSTSHGIGSSHIPAVEPEAAPSPAALPPSAPVDLQKHGENADNQTILVEHSTLPVHHQRHAFLWRIIASSCAMALLAAFLALVALNWRLPAALSPTANLNAKPQSVHLGAVGTIAFLSSNDVDGNSAQGMNDEVVIHLVDVPTPATSTSYFAWMTGSPGSEAIWMPLGRLTWMPTPPPRSHALSSSGSVSSGGMASLFYVSPRHSNLLVTFNRFLITQEATSIPPQQPSPAWIYEASISAISTPGDPNHYSLLDHLRHLLAADPSLAALGIKGGLVYWLTRNTQQVALDSSRLEMDWDAHRFSDLRQHLICMLEYLDGSSFVGTAVPSGTSLPTPSPFTRVGLLTLSSDQELPGYVLHTDIHLEGVRDSLGASASQRQVAARLRTAMNAVGFWLTNVRQDAIQLIRMDDAHLAQPSTLALLRDLATQAQHAFIGSTLGQSGQPISTRAASPTSTEPAEAGAAQALAGVRWIDVQSQQLATFNWYHV
jgi:DNA-binding XRE family transcriptional regulator